MKKYISITLVLGMILSLLSIIPVQALDAAAIYPYTNLTFDTSSDISAFIYRGNYGISRSDVGVGGSNGSAYLTNSQASLGDYEINIKHPEILIGGKAKISAWVKVDTAKTKVKQDTTVNIVIFGPGATTGKGSYHFVKGNVANGTFNSGEWVKIEGVLDNWDGSLDSKEKLDVSKTTRAAIRFGGPSWSISKSDYVASDSPQSVFAFWIDEVRIEPVPGGADNDGETEDTTEEKIVFYDDGTGGKKVGGGKVTWNGGTGCDGKAGYMSFASLDADKVYSDMTTPNLDINYNTLYKVSVWAKADDEDTVGDFIMYNVMRDGRMDRTYDSTQATPPAPYGDYQQIKFDGTLTTEWQYFESYFNRNVKSFDDSTMSIWFRGGNNQCGRKFSMDNIKVEAVGEAVTNGNFEWKKDALPQAVYTTNANTRKDDYARYGTFYSWFENNATVEVSTDVPASSKGTQSAKITTTGADAGINQGLYVTNNTDMVFRFWAKGEGNSIGKSVQVKLDRTVPEVAQPWVKNDKTIPGDEFDVPDVELLGEDLVLTSDWTQYEVHYQPSFTGGTSANVIPRLPFVSIVVDGGAEGLTYYLDDITYEANVEEPKELIPPEITELYVDSSSVVGDKVYFSWMFNTYNDGLDESIIRVTQILENGEEVTLAFQQDWTFTIPQDAGGTSLHFDILPCENVLNENGEEVYLYGDFASYTLENIKTEKVITATLGEIGAEQVTGSLYVENNKGETLDLFLLIALYDENNCAIRYETGTISVDEGLSDTITVSVSSAGAEGFAPVKYAKAIALNGTGVFDTDLIPYTDLVVVEKN